MIESVSEDRLSEGVGRGARRSELMQVAIPTAMDEIENAGGPGRMSASKDA